MYEILFTNFNESKVLTFVLGLFLIDQASQYSFGNSSQIKNTSINQKFLWASVNDVQFLLFTRYNPDEYETLQINDHKVLQDSDFNFNKKVKMFVHGWLSNGTNHLAESIKDAFLNTTDANVIIVDWSNLAWSKYLLASYYVSSVAAQLTDFLKFLVNEGVSTEDIHLVGHSLGAHVVGIAGQYYSNQGKSINAITGLDPAYPLFKYSREDQRLDKRDAKYVEVIHTCAGFLGYPTPLGHVDFYPNGGSNQPGCKWDLTGVCSHDRSAEYFAYSLTSYVPFTAVKCENYEELYNNGYCNRTNETLDMNGLDLHYEKSGVYYLQTKSEPPYALGDPMNWN